MAQDKDLKTPNVPPLRFPGFTDEWKKTTLGEITTNFNLRNKEQIDYPMFSVTNNRGFIPQSEQFEDREMKGEDIKAYKVIHHNDFAYNPARINVGSIAKYNGYEPCMISSLYVCFKANNEVNEDWLMHLLRTPKVQYYYQLNGEGGVRIYLFYPNFARIRTSIPSIEEQKKIAKILSIIDERIATQNKIIDNLQSLIKGLIQHLVHVGLEKGSWHNVMLSEVLQERNELNKEYYPVHSVSVSVGIVNQIEYLGRSFAAKDTAHYHVVRYGDIVYTKSPTGNQPYGIIKQSFCQNPVAVSPLYGVYDPISFEIGNILHYYFLNPLNTNNYLLPLIQKGAKNTINITNGRFLENSIPLPISNDEIISVSKTLSSLSSKIELENSTLDSLLMQRRYLLNQLFI